MSIKFTDAAQIGMVKETGDGFVTAYARAVRTGIQRYTRDELGLMGGGYIDVYRPDEEVFHKDSLRSFSHAPVTINHPAELVDADNWGELAVGEVSTEALRDGEFVALPLILKDRKGIDAVKNGKAELSAGYTAEIELIDGVAPDGTPYGAIQRNIKINHLALVDAARAGSKARIGDAADQWGAAPLTTKGPEMDLIQIMVGDEAVQVAADDANKVNKLIADHAAAIEAKDEEIGTLKAECADTAAKVIDAAGIDELVQAQVAVVDKARTLVADFDATGKSIEAIRREVVQAIHGDEAAAETVTDAEIKGIFDFATAKKKDDTMRKALGDVKATGNSDDVAAGLKKYMNKGS